jgi:uncharacterized protein (TIGR02996 family)
MTNDEAFLEAILERPEDDAPRLVYADWLDEHGDPDRAEFIRLQCGLAGLEEDDPRRPPLLARERELLGRRQQEWLGPLRPLLRRWTFRRGFLDAVAVPARVYLEHDRIPCPATVRRIEVDLEGFASPQPVLQFFPESVAYENVLFPLGFRGRTLVLAMQAPHDTETLTKLQFILNHDVEPVAVPPGQVMEALDRAYGRPELEAVVSWPLTLSLDLDANELDEARDDTPTARLVNLMIAEALSLRASAIRIEPGPEHLRVLYQIDGGLVDRDTPPRRLLGPLVARIRSRAGVAADADAIEQAGRMRGTAHGRPFDLGVVIRPSAEGPIVVLTL